MTFLVHLYAKNNEQKYLREITLNFLSYKHRNFIMILLGVREGGEEQKQANFQEISL